MSYVAIAGIVVSAGVGVYNGYQQRKQQRELAQQAGEAGSDVFGSIPEGISYEPVEYQPVDYGATQMETIRQQQAAMPDINALTAAINASLRGDSAVRIEGWSPGFLANMKLMSNHATSLLSGRLPYSDVMDIVANRGNLSAAIGTPGTGAEATLKDLGMSRLNAMTEGAGMMARIANLSEQIDPIGDRSKPQDWMVTPSQTIPWKIQERIAAAQLASQESQFAHQVAQNNAVLEAMGDPAALGQYGANMMMGLAGGGGGGGSGVDWGKLAGAALNAYAAYQGSQGGGSRFNPDSGTTGGQTNYYQNYGGTGQTHYMSDRPAGLEGGYTYTS